MFRKCCRLTTTVVLTLAASWGQADFPQTFESGGIVVQTPPYDLRCSGVKFGMWNGSAPWPPHPELTPRATIVEGAANNHGTFVAGLMVGKGVSPSDPEQSRGFCPQATISAWNPTASNTEFVSAAADGIVVANNSWGSFIGFYPSGNPPWMNAGFQSEFGAYSSNAAAFDTAIRSIDLAGQTLVTVFTAGDDRNEGPGASNHDGTWFPSLAAENPYFDCIDPQGTGKNTITVGAVDYGFMTAFSCWGPTDDGRIKPDLVAHGRGVYSSVYYPGSYGTGTSTEFAAPAVAGAAGQLVDQYRKLYGTTPRTAMVKALLLNFAQDRGPFGPDYQYGWGYLRVKEPVDNLLLDGGLGRTVRTDTVADAQTRVYALQVPAGSFVPLKVMIAWIDPAAAVGANPALINNLDLRLIDPQGGFHYPWRLSAANPPALAFATGPNTVDNVEQVYVGAPQAGVWEVEVLGDVNVGTTQTFALVSNYVLNAGAPEPVQVAFARNLDGQSVNISWDPVVDPELAGWRIFRSDSIGATSELLDILPPGTTSYTDFTTPAVELLGYDVRAVYLRGQSREISVRPFGLQTPTPRLVRPLHQSTAVTGQPMRILGFAAPGAQVTIQVDPNNPVPLGTVTADYSSGIFWLDHTFGTGGPRQIFAQAILPDLGVSIPSLENQVSVAP